MNERIKELAKQSLPEFYLTNCPSALDKFAELIVEECINVSLKSSHRYDDMGAIIARNIEDHFGVEQ
jgi:hypothetical protein